MQAVRRRFCYRTEFFTLTDLDQVTRALDGLQLGLVNYQALQHQNERQLLRSLIHREVNEPSRSSVVVFLGPDGSYGSENPFRAADLPQSEQRFFYLQYRLARLGAKASRRFVQSMTADLALHLLAKL